MRACSVGRPLLWPSSKSQGGRGLPTRPVGGFLMTLLGPLWITLPRVSCITILLWPYSSCPGHSPPPTVLLSPQNAPLHPRRNLTRPPLSARSSGRVQGPRGISVLPLERSSSPTSRSRSDFGGYEGCICGQASEGSVAPPLFNHRQEHMSVSLTKGTRRDSRWILSQNSDSRKENPSDRFSFEATNRRKIDFLMRQRVSNK